MEVKELVEELRKLTDEQRVEVLGNFCSTCGCYDGEDLIPCQCWNDD